MKNTIYIIVVIILVIIGAIFFIGKEDNDDNNANLTNSIISSTTTMQTESQFIIEDEVVGTGDMAVAGDNVTVNYVGTLLDGTVFDASKNHGDGTFTFPLGAGRVIQGWDQGVAGMKIGGKRKLTIPPELAYGNQQMGSIPANSTLIFEVELLGINK